MLRFDSWLLIIGFWLLVSCGDGEPATNSQEPIVYASPVDYDITLAGNFGEPRPFHFHGGLDVNPVRFISMVVWMSKRAM